MEVNAALWANDARGGLYFTVVLYLYFMYVQAVAACWAAIA